MALGAHELRDRIYTNITNSMTPKVSFEFFPANTESMEKTIRRSIEKLESLNPEFISVTYGADGSTRERTFDAIASIQARGTVDAMPHLTCVGALKEDIASIADEYYELGIRKIMALRGDPQGGAGAAYVPTEGGFPYAEQLVEGLAAQHDFDIYVAAYPETHPDAPSPHFDLQNLKRKFDAGASTAITQYFFNTESYLRFRDAAVRMGIDNPIIPGILPVTNFATLQRFSKASSIALPKWLETAFAGLDAEPETRQLITANIAIEQVIALQAEGVNDFHFYTLNRAELCYAVCHALGVRRALTNENTTVEAAA